MLTKQNILNDLKRISKIYKELFLDPPNYCEANNIISWKNYKPSIFKSFYVREYEQLFNLRQYTFLLLDKSFFQFYYQFDNNDKIKEAKLSFYPYPIILEYENVETNYFDASDIVMEEYYYDLWNLLNSQFGVPINEIEKLKSINVNIDITKYTLMKFEEKYKLTNTSHIRIDYDDEVTSHHKCEIQFGGIKNIRLPLNKLISPFSFFDFIIKNLSFKSKGKFGKYNDINSKHNFLTEYNLSKKIHKEVENFSERNIYIIQE